MNIESQDALDQLLGAWAASREADEQHTRRLADQILAVARDLPAQVSNASATDASPFADRPVPASIHTASMSDADWGGKLMIGGGGLLLFLLLAGCLLWYNLVTVPPGNPRQLRPIASGGNLSPTTTDASEPPAAASLGATVLAAKQQLLAETNSLFDDQLTWIADGQREVSFGMSDQAARDSGEFMLVRVVVAQRASPGAPWSTMWQTDVISRSEALVEIAPKQLDGSSLALWTYQMPDGNVAVDMDLILNQQSGMRSSSSTVLQAGQPTRVGCSTEDGVEHCVFQTVMPLTRSQI